MARTDKYKSVEASKEVDLVPFMNLLAILIPALLISTEYIKIATIAVSSPQIGPSQPVEKEEKPDEKPPLNLTIAVSSLGLYVASANNVLPADEDGATGPTVPKVNVKVYMGRDKTGKEKEFMRIWEYDGKKYYMGVKEVSDEELAIRVEQKKSLGPVRILDEMDHNYPMLQERLVKIKKDWKDETQVIVSADPNVEFTTIVRVMDASRHHLDDGERKPLFPQVVLSAGVV